MQSPFKVKNSGYISPPSELNSPKPTALRDNPFKNILGKIVKKQGVQQGEKDRTKRKSGQWAKGENKGILSRNHHKNKLSMENVIHKTVSLFNQNENPEQHIEKNTLYKQSILLIQNSQHFPSQKNNQRFVRSPLSKIDNSISKIISTPKVAEYQEQDSISLVDDYRRKSSGQKAPLFSARIEQLHKRNPS